MPISPHTELIPVASIWVDREKRQRREFDTSDLEPSIKQIGLINPIIVTKELELKAGERRWTAFRNLGIELIPARFFESLDPIEAMIVEFDENAKRKDLDWKEIVSAALRVQDLMKEQDPLVTQEAVALRLSLIPGTLSIYLRVGRSMSDPRVAEAKTVREAYNILARRDQRAAADELNELVSFVQVIEKEAPVLSAPQLDADLAPVAPVPVPAPRSVAPPAPPHPGIIQGDFLQWAPTYSGPKFNLIHCDFPYGVNVFSGPQARGAEGAVESYDDRPEVYLELIDCLCENFDRFASISCHLMFWTSARPEIIQKTREVLSRRIPSLVFTPFPLIWFKSDNMGIAGDAKRDPRHVYETALFAHRSGRQTLRMVSDTYACHTDKRLHPSCKPETMLKHFFSSVVDETTSILDPTAGSGAALRAADALGAARCLGLEKNAEFAQSAEKAFQTQRMLRLASKGA